MVGILSGVVSDYRRKYVQTRALRSWRVILHRIRWLLLALEGIKTHGHNAQASSAKGYKLENPAATDAALLPIIDNLLSGLSRSRLLANHRAELLFQVHGSWR